MYYLRAKIPPPLRHIVGKAEIVVSLKTREPEQAVKRVKIESLKADRVISEAEAKLRGLPGDVETTDEELRWMAAKAFVDFENDALKHDSKFLPSLDEVERDEIVVGRKEEYAMLHGSRAYPDHETRSYQHTFVEKAAAKFSIIPGTPLFERAFPLFLESAQEAFRRSIDRARDREPARQAFRELDATSILPPAPTSRVTLGRLLDEFMTYQRKVRSVNTPAAYVTSIKVLRECLGNGKILTEVTKQDMEEVFAFLAQVPVNAAQRYPKLSLEKAIEKADRNNDTRRLSTRTLKNYVVHFTAIFHYAIDYGYMRDNPAKSRLLRDAIKTGEKPKRKALFTVDQLNALFRAPLYTGCLDDRRYMKPGPNRPRRGRFWVPLLGLFQGLRCNEACQIHTSDVGVEDGIPFIEIREDTAEGAETEKRLKTSSSQRKIPVHPELLRIGFMEFVEQRRTDPESAKLFPDLKFHEGKQTYSHDFSKWFRKFVQGACGSNVNATFHSFRHHFRTALMGAGVAIELTEALGGWSSKSSSEIEYRHANLPMLKSALEKVVYPGLDPI